MTDEISKYVTKFDGSNYQSWKFQIRNIIASHGLTGHVDGTEARPAGAETTEAVKKWKKDDAKAMSVIAVAMDHTQLENLLTCTTAAEMWSTLCSIHELTSETNKLLLLQKFHEYRMSANDTAVQHVARVQNMAAQVAELGEKMSPTAIMAKILCTLPAKYSALATAWDSVDPEHQTILFF